MNISYRIYLCLKCRSIAYTWYRYNKPFENDLRFAEPVVVGKPLCGESSGRIGSDIDHLEACTGLFRNPVLTNTGSSNRWQSFDHLSYMQIWLSVLKHTCTRTTWLSLALLHSLSTLQPADMVEDWINSCTILITSPWSVTCDTRGGNVSSPRLRRPETRSRFRLEYLEQLESALIWRCCRTSDCLERRCRRQRTE